jgi:predicted DNA-binding transcriptional regulator AlpA
MKLSRDADWPERLWSVKEVAEILSLSPRSVWRYVALGKLPPPIRLGARSVRWRASDLQRYLDSLTPC